VYIPQYMLSKGDYNNYCIESMPKGSNFQKTLQKNVSSVLECT